MDLVFRAASIHRKNFDPNVVQLSSLVSLKTGGCPENCAYCPQSAHYSTGVKRTGMMPIEEILKAARTAKARGATRFCMGGAWRSPPKKEMPALVEAIREVKKLGLETCGTFGMIDEKEAEEFKEAGLDYYNHNVDTSQEFYGNIISTHEQKDRTDTIGNLGKAGVKACCGGIVGMNETREDRVGFIFRVCNLDPQPQSVPINLLVKVPGTPLEDAEALDWSEYVRTVAVARITCPKSHVRMAAGRSGMPEAMQALCFLAGANSFFIGDKLLVTPNAELDGDELLLKKLGMRPERLEETMEHTSQSLWRDGEAEEAVNSVVEAQQKV